MNERMGTCRRLAEIKRQQEEAAAEAARKAAEKKERRRRRRQAVRGTFTFFLFGPAPS